MAFPTGWTRKKSRPINGSSDDALSDYQMEVITITFESDMKSDFGDIRFIDSDETTLLDHALLSKTDSTTADYIVKVPSIPQSTSKTIYVIWGNSSATSASDPESTFEQYDPCTGTFSTLWDIVHAGGGSQGYDTVGGRSCIKISNSGDYCLIMGKTSLTAPFKIEFDIYLSDYIALIQYMLPSSPSGESDRYRARFDSRSSYNELIDKAGTEIGSSANLSLSTGQWYTARLTVDAAGHHIWKLNNQTGATATDTTYTSGYIGFESTWNGYTAIANIRVSKYTEHPPTWGDWGVTEDIIPTYHADLKTLVYIPVVVGWLDPLWLYQAEIPITGSTDETKTNYPVLVEIPYIEGMMREDFGDIRFTLNDGKTELDYVLVTVSAEAPDYPATFKVEIPNLPESPNITSIYYYSGNTEALTTSNPKNVYTVYDDFEDETLDTTLWVGNHGVEEESGNLVLDYHSNNEEGAEDYVYGSGTRIYPNSRTTFKVRPETLDGPLRFGLSTTRCTFQSDVLLYMGFVLANEYINTNVHHHSDTGEHDTIQTYDLTDHICMIEWLEEAEADNYTINFYYDGELIKSYEHMVFYPDTEAFYILIRDRGTVDEVIVEQITPNPPVVGTLGDLNRPSAYLRTLVNVPYSNDLKTLVNVAPVHDDLKTLVEVRQSKTDDLLTRVKVLPLHSDLKTLVYVRGVFNADLKTLVTVPNPYTYLCHADIPTTVEVVQGETITNIADLKTIVTVGNVASKQLNLKWNVVRGSPTTEDVENPVFIMEVDGGYYD